MVWDLKGCEKGFAIPSNTARGSGHLGGHVQSRRAEALKFEVGRLDRLVGVLQPGCRKDKHSESDIGLHCDCALTVYMQTIINKISSCFRDFIGAIRHYF